MSTQKSNENKFNIFLYHFLPPLIVVIFIVALLLILLPLSNFVPSLLRFLGVIVFIMFFNELFYSIFKIKIEACCKPVYNLNSSSPFGFSSPAQAFISVFFFLIFTIASVYFFPTISDVLAPYYQEQHINRFFATFFISIYKVMIILFIYIVIILPLQIWLFKDSTCELYNMLRKTLYFSLTIPIPLLHILPNFFRFIFSPIISTTLSEQYYETLREIKSNLNIDRSIIIFEIIIKFISITLISIPIMLLYYIFIMLDVKITSRIIFLSAQLLIILLIGIFFLYKVHKAQKSLTEKKNIFIKTFSKNYTIGKIEELSHEIYNSKSLNSKIRFPLLGFLIGAISTVLVTPIESIIYTFVRSFLCYLLDSIDNVFYFFYPEGLPIIIIALITFIAFIRFIYDLFEITVFEKKLMLSVLKSSKYEILDSEKYAPPSNT